MRIENKCKINLKYWFERLWHSICFVLEQKTESFLKKFETSIVFSICTLLVSRGEIDFVNYAIAKDLLVTSHYKKAQKVYFCSISNKNSIRHCGLDSRYHLRSRSILNQGQGLTVERELTGKCRYLGRSRKIECLGFWSWPVEKRVDSSVETFKTKNRDKKVLKGNWQKSAKKIMTFNNIGLD